MSRFVFDKEKLNYSRVGKNLRDKLLRISAYFMASLTIAIFLNILYALFFNTPHERQLKQENASLLQDYEFLNRRFSQIDTVLTSLRARDENIYRMIFETEPVKRPGISYTDHQSGYYFQFMDKRNDLLVIETVSILDSIYMNINSEEYRNLISVAYSRKEMLQCIPAIQPISNKELIKAASGFGYRIHPIYKINKFHSGVDFTAPIGTSVLATGDGIVEELTNTRRGSGNTIIIDHGFGYKSSYSHLDGFNVKKGQKVKRGTVIGRVGNTGLSVAPHLHYEVLLNNEPVNPVNYYFLELSPEEYDRMIELSMKSGQSFD
jgi:murein DD-endopeptidase MepM/ murein hydrolase activator NlpD